MANKTEAKSKKKRDKARAVKARPKTLAAKPRQVKKSLPRWYHFLRPKDVSFTKLPNVVELTRSSIGALWLNRRVFAGITVIYGVLNLLLVQGLASGSQISTLKGDLSQVGHGHLSSIGTSFGGFSQIVGSSNGSSQSAGSYQLVLAIITSLAVIWSLRQIYTGKKVKLRDAYYRGMYPLVPFILVLMVIFLEFIPLIVGGSIYTVVVSSGIAASRLEKFIWLVVFIFSGIITLYLLCSTLFALYVVTLPDMTPIKAMKSARRLVRYRRLMILRKLVWLPFILLVASAIVLLPIVLWLTALTEAVFFALSIFALVAANSYLYNLYRELLE